MRILIILKWIEDDEDTTDVATNDATNDTQDDMKLI